MPNLTDNVELKKQGFIYEATETTSEAMTDLPPNRTLLTADLTDKPATSPEMVYGLETVEDVFNHFKPECKVEFLDEKGASVNEQLAFQNIGDFGRDALVRKSDFLRTLAGRQDDHVMFERRLRNNKVLQAILSDPEKKQAYITVLQAMLQELEGA